jgi:hypothetical protein
MPEWKLLSMNAAHVINCILVCPFVAFQIATGGTESAISGDQMRPTSRKQVPSLIVKLFIDRRDVLVKEVQIVMTPYRQPKDFVPEMITLIGRNNGVVVSSIQTSDPRVSIEEKSGPVITEKREAVAALPLPSRIDELQVQLPGKTKPQTVTIVPDINLEQIINEFCKSFNVKPLCLP